MQHILDEIQSIIQNENISGTVASYIPELGKIDPEKFGMYLHQLDGSDAKVGDWETGFSIQSISKVFATALAFSKVGDKLWNRVGKEPSGSSFNSLVRLEYENGIPRNPLINAGAIVVADVLLDLLDNPAEDFLAFVQLLAGGRRQ